jgi:hypothetical protein
MLLTIKLLKFLKSVFAELDALPFVLVFRYLCVCLLLPYIFVLENYKNLTILTA